MRIAKRIKALELINVIALVVAVIVADVVTANWESQLEAMLAVFLIVLVEFFCVELNLIGRSGPTTPVSSERRRKPTAIYKRRYQFASFWLILAFLAWFIDGLRYLDPETVRYHYSWIFIHPALVFFSVIAIGLLTAGIVWFLQKKKSRD